MVRVFKMHFLTSFSHFIPLHAVLAEHHNAISSRLLLKLKYKRDVESPAASDIKQFRYLHHLQTRITSSLELVLLSTIYNHLNI